MKIIGLISGTSADAIDAVIAEIDGPADAIQVTEVAFEMIPWSAQERARIFRLFEGEASLAEVCRANFAVAEEFAAAALAIIERAGLTPGDIDLIGSHGQTIWHDVDAESGRVTSTLQIGDPSVIAARTGITTVANFRTADVAAGGQGAPLVSTFDWLLLRPPANLNGVTGGWRAVQNIGGIANVTFLPPRDLEAAPLAFDTGPGNALIDRVVTRITHGQLTYDVDGEIGASGEVHTGLLTEWLSHPYFQQQPPKSTGRELFSLQLADDFHTNARQRGIGDADLVATLAELTAVSIADAYLRFAPGPVAQVVVGGGGSRNPLLMMRLRHWINQRLNHFTEVTNHAILGFDDQAKESLAFALLAYLAIDGQPGNVLACTGADQRQILGQIAPGSNYLQFRHNNLCSVVQSP